VRHGNIQAINKLLVALLNSKKLLAVMAIENHLGRRRYT
jgi:hypothetical protein